MVHFFTFFYSHRASLSVRHSHLKLSSLKTLLRSLSQTITSLFHRYWLDSSSTSPPTKLDVTNPLVVPSCQSTSDPRHHQPQTDFSSTNPLQVSCLCLLHVDAWDFWFGYNIKECGIFDLGITSKNVLNDFFFLFFQFIILDAIIFLLFLLNEKFCHLISEYPFVLIRFDSVHPWMDRMYLIGMYWEFSICRNLLCGFLVKEVLVLVLCSVAQNQKQKHTKKDFLWSF